MVFLETGEFFKSMFSVKKAVKRLSEAQCLQLQKNPNEGDYLCPQSVFLAPNLTQVVNNLPANAGVTGDGGLIPGSGRSPGGGKNTPSPASPELAGGFFTTEPPDKLQAIEYTHNFEIFLERGEEGFITCSK